MMIGMNRPSTIEILEQRTLFTVSPTVQADLGAIAAQQQQFNTDRAAGLTQIASDRAAVVNDRLNAARGDPALIQKLKSDVQFFTDKFKQDAINLHAMLATDRQQILADTLQLRADHGNLAATAADHLRIISDFTKVRSDVQAFASTHVADLASRRTTMLQDLSDIAQSRVSPTLVADQQKLSSNVLTLQQTLKNDAVALQGDRAKLVTDIRNKV
jgi:hypothetical protein